jgi:hypothetical protein
MKPLVLGLSAFAFAGCTGERAAAPASSASATKEERTLEERVRSVDAFLASEGEPEPAATISPVLTQRALKEFSARVPGAKKKEAKIRFVGGSLAIVTVTYTLADTDAQREQEIQFIHSHRAWTMSWIPTPPKKQADPTPRPTR